MSSAIRVSPALTTADDEGCSGLTNISSAAHSLQDLQCRSPAGDGLQCPARSPSCAHDTQDRPRAVPTALAHHKALGMEPQGRIRPWASPGPRRAGGSSPWPPRLAVAPLPSPPAMRPQLRSWQGPSARLPPARPPDKEPSPPQSQGDDPAGAIRAPRGQPRAGPAMALLGALLLALALLCSWRLARRRDSPGSGLGRPRSLPALPLLGSLLQLAGHPQLHLRLWRLQGHYGSLYALWMGSHYVVVVNSYRHAREVLLKKGKDFAGRPRTVSRQQVLGTPSTVAWGEEGDAPTEDAGTQQGPCPLPILPAASQGRAAPPYPAPGAGSPVILRPEGACSSCSWRHPWARGCGLRYYQAPLKFPAHPRAPNLRIMSPRQGESKPHVLCFACLQ